MVTVKKRLFIAIDISDEAREAAKRYIDQMKTAFQTIPAKWERPEKLHLTLKFLGSIDELLIGRIINVVDRNADSSRSFDVEILGTGAFPSVKNPRVLWIGVKDPSGEMKDLAKRIDSDCFDLGIDAEKRSFTPHLTLARIRDPRHAAPLSAQHSANDFGPFRFVCNEIVIYESHLRRTGSTYEKLHTSKF